MATLEPRGPTQRADSTPASFLREDGVKLTGDGGLDIGPGGVSLQPISTVRPNAMAGCISTFPDVSQSFEKVSLASPEIAKYLFNQQYDDISGISAKHDVSALATSKLANQGGPKVRRFICI